MFGKELNPVLHYTSLLRLALPSILLQSGAPLAITFQTALLGRKGTELVAAWAIVASKRCHAAFTSLLSSTKNDLRFPSFFNYTVVFLSYSLLTEIV